MSLLLSLFPGIGLLDMAFEESFCVVRGPDLLWGGDIRTFHPPAGCFDGVVGGPPCQTFSSLANLVRAKGHEPRFGNLIPEFERCVAEARPDWFLMENVGGAPVPVVEGYGVNAFILDNCHLDSGDGYGEEQMRTRRFSFGLLGSAAPDLRRWIVPAALLLPRRASTVVGSPVMAQGSDRGEGPRSRSGAVSQTHIDNSPEAKARTGAVRGTPRIREQCALGGHAVPVAHGGSGKRKPGARSPSVTSSDGAGSIGLREGHVTERQDDGVRGARNVAVTAAHSGAGRPKGGHLIVYRWDRMLELQGLPPDFLEDAPFTAEGKRKAVANGVPLPMGRAIARAVKEALADRAEATA